MIVYDNEGTSGELNWDPNFYCAFREMTKWKEAQVQLRINLENNMKS